MEDNALQKRCDHYGIKIDRSTFYDIGSPQILQLFDGITRIISKKDPWRMDKDNGIDGLKTITTLKFNISSKSDNPNDNIFIVDNQRIFVINIQTFLTHVRFENDQFYNYDLREPKRKIINPDKLKETNQIMPVTNDWTNIPYYPTSKERREILAKSLLSQGKQIPQDLLLQLEKDKIDEVKGDIYNQSIVQPQKQQPQQPQQHQQPQQPQQYQHKPQQQVPNKFSPEYARYIGHKPKATASARIHLGGIY
jgi:hypothetical protein